MEIHTFSEMMLSEEVAKAIQKLGLETPTSVQKKAIPLMMEGHSLIAKAPTGTGKTFAFGIPILEYLNMRSTFVQNLILCPTRELALQICSELRILGQYIKGLRICPIIGGQRMDAQIRELAGNPQIVVATPGRLLDHISRNNVDISSVYTVVLDEADEMLSMGFFKDIRRILDLTPADKQIALFSATMSRDVMDISWQYLQGATEIDVAPKAEDMPQIRQFVVNVPEKDKLQALTSIIRENHYTKIIVFCNTKTRVRHLTDQVRKAGLSADCLHGDINQSMRNKIMDGYRNGKFEMLIATDIAARGIDVSDVDGVFNFDVPKENEYYLHRIGRTGRAKKEGAAYTLVSFVEKPRMEEIIRYTKVSVEELPFALK